MFDIFYSGVKPGLFAHERQARDVVHAGELSSTRYFWWTNYLTDYSRFDFLFEPPPWQSDQRHAWPSQWQRDSGTYLIPKKGSVDTNYHTEKILKRLKDLTNVIEIDHMDDNCGLVPGTTKTVRYFDNYRDTLARIARTADSEYVWICSSVCDYTDFDFSWHPDHWQSAMLHVFASNEEKFGDTFYMHTPTFRQRIGQFTLLDWYEINFIAKGVPRRPLPLIEHRDDTHVTAVQTQNWAGPLAVFSTNGTVDTVPTVPLWREKTKNIVPLSAGASQVIVPRAAVPYIRTQLYDYANIDRTQRHMYTDQPLDIVFISNGESGADRNYNQLSDSLSGKDNQLHWVKDVNGRVAAYHAAAQASTTAWFFAVFAKLCINKEFNWAWQPDRLQEPKHYIFHAHNPVTGLTYGHQAMIAYNKKLVLNNLGQGLDFTLDSAHEVVPILSGTAEYADTKWSAWRTAFREVLKLKCNTDVDSEYRLGKWLKNHGALKNGEWSRYGAEDAVEYYDTVAGNFDELKKSYDWTWLASYAFMRRNLLTNQ